VGVDWSGTQSEEVTMAHVETPARPHPPAPGRQRTLPVRRAGYAAGALVNALMLGVVNVWPGWRALPFLTDDMALVLGLVNGSIAVGVLVNLAYVVSDRPLVKAVGDIVQPAVGIAALVRLWQVFPFDFEPGGLDWQLLARWVIAVGVGGSAVGMVMTAGNFAKALRDGT
jgi:hypothetical protein